MTTNELHNRQLDLINEAASQNGLPVVRVRKTGAVGIIVLSPDVKRRVVIEVSGVRSVIYIGQIDLLTIGRAVTINGERHLITGVQSERGKEIKVVTQHGGKTYNKPATAIEGVNR